MKTLKTVLRQLPLYLALIVLAVIFWSWLFGLRLNVKPEKKLVVYIDAAGTDELALAERLAPTMPEGIERVEVRLFSYALFDTEAIKKADLYIVPESAAAGYRDSFVPLPVETNGKLLSFDGVPYGVRVYHAETDKGAAHDLIDYRTSEGTKEDFYLFFSAGSVHLPGNADAVDGAALPLAEALLAMNEDDAEAPVTLPEGFILGMDVSSLLSEEASSVKYYDFTGNEQDVLKTLAQNGITHLRVRVWNDPFDAEGHGYGGGNCDLETALTIGRRGAEEGLKLIVDFHYSDFWADPGKQAVPKAWEGLPLDEKSEALYEYTKMSLQRLRDEGVPVAMVQIGNETNGALCGEKTWAGVHTLMEAGAKAVREVLPEAKIALHFTNPERAGAYADIAKRLSQAGVDYDVFASSYYPFWHGTLENLSAVLSDVHKTYGKDVLVMETSYPYTDKDTDFWGNTVGAGSASALPFPYTVQGQADAVKAVIETVANTDGGIGVVYWEGAWISVGGKSQAENKKTWETFGSGWATSFAGTYDPKDAGRYFGGCAVDNQAFFDENGKPLSSLRTFSTFLN